MKSKINIHQPEITILRRRIEEVFGRAVVAPKDYEELSDALKNKVSSHTIKRLFGYIKSYDLIRFSTLNILAEYAGYASWNDFLQVLQRNSKVESTELHQEIIKSDDLSVGNIVDIAWLPDRVCRLRYLGDYQYEVVEAKNSKLKVGNTFSCRMFIKGETLYVDNLKQEAITHSAYAIGLDNGLTSVCVLKL